MKMNEDKIIQSINSSISNITPNVYKSIQNSLKKEEKMSLKNLLKWGFKTVITACAVFMIFFTVRYYNNNYKIDSLVSIDVNPSIELKVSKSKKVITAIPLNEGGIKILDNMDLKGIPLNIAVNALTGSMVKYGFLTGDDANVLVTVQNDNYKVTEEIKTIITDTIENSLNGYEVKAVVLNQISDTEKSNSVEVFAEKNNISYGKSLFIDKLVKKDSTLVATDLAKMSIREISNLVHNKNLNIGDLVEVDEDDSTYEKIEDAIEDANEEKQIEKETNTNSFIGKDKAKSIALDHAGVKANNVSIKLTTDDGIKIYDIEFKTDDKKYEYEINAISGKIIDYDTEIIKKEVKSTSTTTYIGETKAKSIAFSHAGINSSDTSMIKIVLDTDNGIKVYDIDFKVGNYEYEYEINAINGKILDFDKEIDD